VNDYGVIHQVENDPAFQTSLRGTLKEVRDNIAEHGRDEAIEMQFAFSCRAVQISPMSIAAMSAIILFHYAESFPLIEEYAQAVSQNTMLLSQGDLVAAEEAALRAASLLARIRLETL
jgi:uncharacterized membrane protein YjdF